MSGLFSALPNVREKTILVQWKESAWIDDGSTRFLPFLEPEWELVLSRQM
jgi:hypothetical protein